MQMLAISRSSLYELIKEGLLDVVRPRPKIVRFRTRASAGADRSRCEADDVPKSSESEGRSYG